MGQEWQPVAVKGIAAAPAKAPAPPKRVGFWFGAGLVVLPYVFAWFTLRRGYSPLVRSLAFGWLAVIVVGAIAPKPDPVQQEKAAAEAHLDAWRDANLSDAKAKVLAELKDPDSAKFREVDVIKQVHPDTKHFGTVCGYVNAKNGFGGYTGFKPFMVMSGIPLLDSDSSAFRHFWNRDCAGKEAM